MEGLNQAADLGRGAGGSRGEEIRIRNILLGTEGEQEGDEPVDHPAHEDGEPDGGVQEEEQEGVEKGRKLWAFFLSGRSGQARNGSALLP